VERQPVTQEAFEATLSHLPAVVADLLRLMRLTGCRPTEACCIARCEVDTTTTPWVWTPRKHKTQGRGRKRVIAIGPRARAILERWWQGKPDDVPTFTRDDLKPACDGITPMRALRTSQRRFDYADVRRRVQKACELAGVERWCPYQVRHAHLTELRESAGRDVAQAQAGHSNGSVTERYAKPSVGLQAAALEAIG
jgi:integrase